MYAAALVVVVFVVAALVVDSYVMFDAYPRADSIATQAARVAGQRVDPNPAGESAQIDPAAARLAGLAYLEASGCVDGTIVIAGTNITATCPYPYTVVFTPGHYQANGTGSATPLWVD